MTPERFTLDAATWGLDIPGDTDLILAKDHDAAVAAAREKGRREGLEKAALVCGRFDAPPTDSEFIMGQATAAQQIRAGIRALIEGERP